MKETAIKVGGKSYLLTALDAQAMRDIHEEFQRTAPDPIAELMDVANQLPEAMREGYIKENLNAAVNRKRSRASLDSVEFRQWVEANPLDAAGRVYHAMFKKHHPELTRDECFNLALQALEEGGADAFRDLFPSKLESTKTVKGRRASVPTK